MADLSTLLPDGDVLWEGDNVIELPNLVSGPLAELLAAAGAQGHTWELAGEATMRHEFRVAASEWPSSRRHPRRASAAFAASLVAGTILATTGLAAATGLPLPTTHLVDQAITQINQDLASPPTAVALTGLRPGVTPFIHHAVVHGGATVHALRHVPVTSTSASTACTSGTTATGGSAGSCLPARSAVPIASGSATTSAGTVTAAMSATHTPKATATKSGTHKTTKSRTHKTGGGGSSRGGNHGRGGTHKTGGGGSSRGGNHGRGRTHKTGGGGSSRGGNHGRGGTHKTGGGGSSRGGNRGPAGGGSSRGGNRGTATA